MADIRTYIQSHLLAPLKTYNTVIQDTMLTNISDMLAELYEDTVEFPDIVSPNSYRLDILKTIADQFVYTVRDDADLEEQVDILSNILDVYNKRGSVDTIEHMWEYYGGTLPKEVKVIIPSYSLFKYSTSAFSGSHVFPNDPTDTHIGSAYQFGVYEIRLTNNTYPIPELHDFLVKELVAAGNYFYFTNACHLEVLGNLPDSSPYKYNVQEDNLKELQLTVLQYNQGFTWSGYNPMSIKSEESLWSGKGAIYLEIVHLLNMYGVSMVSKPWHSYGVYRTILNSISDIKYAIDCRSQKIHYLKSYAYSTLRVYASLISRYLYDAEGNLITSEYPGYFILGNSLLGKEVI